MRIRVSDPRAIRDLVRYLADQGFPASRTSTHELDVLFPGAPGIFATAVELDLWNERNGKVVVSIVGEGGSS